jgi:hypothetical protein
MLPLAGLLALAPFAQAQDVAKDPSFFGAKVYPILETAQCRGCHAEDGVASATRLHFPERDASPDRILAFGLTLANLVDRSDPSKSLLLNKPTKHIPHTGGERIKAGSPDEQVLAAWVRYLATVPDDVVASARRKLNEVTAGAKPDQFVRRLTHSQYNATVRDLLGDYSKPADHFPPEDFIDGFKNQLRTQGMPPLLVDSYSTSAERMALNAFRAGDVNGLIPCKPTSANDSKCREQFIRSFGQRAFRRPLTDIEIRRYSTVFIIQARSGNRFQDGARAVVEAMLQSPKFLFHVEEGPNGRYRDYDIASRLSYLLWNSMPDQTLFDAAASGELETPDGRAKAVRRMLDNPKAREAVDEYFTEWLRFDRVLNTVKDGRRYPEFTPELAAFSVEETRRLLDHLVWDDGNFMEALTANYGYLNSDLATLYNMPQPANEFQLVRFPADARRAGLLGQASFLAASAGPVETSPTARGIFVREQLLCQKVPAPPPGVNTNLPEPTVDKPLTRRQRLSEHTTNATCAGCHRLMDPIGFGLEGFDAIGRWREKETILVLPEEDTKKSKPKRVDLPLDSNGEVAGIPNSQFSDSLKLGQILAGSPVCQECMVRQLFRYAYGRMETPADTETIHQLFVTFRDSGFRFKTLLMALVRSPEFLEGLDNKEKAAQSKATIARR